jgi:hypothetical protein
MGETKPETKSTFAVVTATLNAVNVAQAAFLRNGDRLFSSVSIMPATTGNAGTVYICSPGMTTGWPIVKGQTNPTLLIGPIRASDVWVSGPNAGDSVVLIGTGIQE